MTVPRILGALVPLALLVPVAAVVDTAAAATEAEVSIKGAPKLGIYHDDIGPDTADVVRHRGRLTTADGDPVDGASVHLQRKLAGGEWLTFDEEEVTDADGRYEFASYVEGNASYRVSYEGDDVYASAVSAAERLKAMRDFNAQLVEKDQKAVLKGNINPGWDNRTVAWLKKTCRSCKWRTVDTAKSGDHGSWRFEAGYPPVGEKWYFHAAVGKTSDFVTSYSARLITTTTPSRAPAARVARR